MNRRSFFQNLALIGTGTLVAPSLFLPKFERVKWKVHYLDHPIICDPRIPCGVWTMDVWDDRGVLVAHASEPEGRGNLISTQGQLHVEAGRMVRLAYSTRMDGNEVPVFARTYYQYEPRHYSIGTVCYPADRSAAGGDASGVLIMPRPSTFTVCRVTGEGRVPVCPVPT